MFVNKSFDDIFNDFDNKKNSHSYIFYTNDFLACQNDVNQLVECILKTDNLNLNASDYIVVKKSDNKNILKEDITRVKDMFQNKSYLNNKRVYLIEEAHKLNSTSANMILKFLEEPLEGIVALFITTNLDAVLTTIKSRCQIVNAFYKDKLENTSNNADSIIEDLFNGNKYINIVITKKKLKDYDRGELINLFNNYLIKCYNKLNDELILKRIIILNKIIGMLNNNVSVDYVLDYLFLEGSD